MRSTDSRFGYDPSKPNTNAFFTVYSRLFQIIQLKRCQLFLFLSLTFWLPRFHSTAFVGIQTFIFHNFLIGHKRNAFLDYFHCQCDWLKELSTSVEYMKNDGRKKQFFSVVTSAMAVLEFSYISE